MAQVIHRRFITNGKIAWPLGTTIIGQLYETGAFVLSEGWYVVRGLPPEFYEGHNGCYAKGFFSMTIKFCAICGGRGEHMLMVPANLLRKYLPAFPEEWWQLPVCKTRQRCLNLNPKLEKVILECKREQAKERRNIKKAQRAIAKLDAQKREATEGMDQEPAGSSKTGDTMHLRDEPMVAAEDQGATDSMEMPKVPSKPKRAKAKK